MKIIGIVPAKGTSKRIKDKNLQLIEANGKTLVELAVERLLDCNMIEKVFLDTDDQRIIDVCSHLPVEIMIRPKHLTSNKINFNNLIMWEIETFGLSHSDLLVHTFSTAPFLTSKTINFVVKTLDDNRHLDSGITVRSIKKPFWYENKPSYDVKVLKSTSKMSPLLIETGGLYTFYVHTFLRWGKRIGSDPLFYNVDMIEGLDIDEPEDLELARRLYGKF